MNKGLIYRFFRSQLCEYPDQESLDRAYLRYLRYCESYVEEFHDQLTWGECLLRAYWRRSRQLRAIEEMKIARRERARG